MSATLLPLLPVMRREIREPQPDVTTWAIADIPLNVLIMDFSVKSRRRKPFSTSARINKSPDKK